MADEIVKEYVAPTTNFVKLDGCMYSIEKISDDGNDAEKKIIEYHKAIFKETVEKLQKAQHKENFTDWDKQINKLTRRTGNNEITIPRNLYKEMLMVWQNKLCVAKTVCYAPHSISGRSGYTDNISRAIDTLGIRSKIEKYSNWIIKFKAPFRIPIIAIKNIGSNTVYTPNCITYHTFSSDRRVCTGNYKDFFDVSEEELEYRFGRINVTSLTTVTMEYKGKTQSLNELLLSVDKKSIEVVNERIEAWKI